jgi:hypothetical protein
VLSALLTPRIEISVAPPLFAICTLGTRSVRLEALMAPAFFRSSPETTLSDSGVFDAGCATRCAVTMTSWMAPAGAAAVAWSGSSARACAGAMLAMRTATAAAMVCCLDRLCTNMMCPFYKYRYHCASVG